MLEDFINNSDSNNVSVVSAVRKAAEEGNAEAQYHLGLCYFVGVGVKQNYATASEWFRKAAEQEIPKAQYFLGYCYIRGMGVTKDASLGYKWIKKAAEQGELTAQRSLNIVEIKIPFDKKVLKSIDFDNPPLIDSLILSEGIETIQEGALAGCTSLYRIVIPKSVKSIGECVFTICPSLSEIHILHENPNVIAEEIAEATYTTEPSYMCDPYPEDEPYMEFDFENTTLYVPAQSVDAYRKHEFFEQCNFHIEAETLSEEELFKPREYVIDTTSSPRYLEELYMMTMKGYKFDYFLFWGHRNRTNKITKSCLSQWYPCRFEIDGIEYNCAEQYMMAEKARSFKDTGTLAKILASDNPDIIKKLGREVRNFNEHVWRMESRSAVVKGNVAKFLQNKNLGDFLLGTGEKILVEASPYDRIWGIGMRDSKEAYDPNNWKGTNELGFALMEVRDILRNLREIEELFHQQRNSQNESGISINGESFPENGWAIIFAGGSSSGKSSLIRNGEMKIKGEVLSTDSMGEKIMEVHNNAKYYETHDPQRLAAAEELLHKGIKSRFGETAARNLRLDFHDPCFSAERVSAILSNGAHDLKKKIYTDAIRKYAAEDHRNVILDMTGKQGEVEYYTRLCREQGYKVAFLWVICNMSQALLWNHRRERTMKPIGVYSGHHNPKKYLPDFLSTPKALEFDEVWLVFNSTESWQRPMTDEEKAGRIIKMERGQLGFRLDDKLRQRIISVLGPYEDEKYIPIPDMQKLFVRYRLMQKYAADNDISIARFEDMIPSFELKDKETIESNIKSFYSQLGMKEPRMPKQPRSVNNVVEPVRAMYDSDEKYAEALVHYPEQKEAYQKAKKEWDAYEESFQPKEKRDMKKILSYLYDFNKNPIDTYSKKVQDVYETIQKAEGADVAPLVAFFKKAKESGLPICFFGAGGAASPATFATQLANAEGFVAQTLTPMAVMTLPSSVVSKMQFVAITASGGPVDMQAAVEYLLNISPENVYCLTTNSIDHKSRFGRFDNVVGQMVKNAAPDHAICINLSIHRDGFVGVNKHVGLSLLLYRAFHPEENGFASNLLVPTQTPFEARLPEGMDLQDISDLHILYGALGRAAANDMEGRMLEAGVMPAMATDMKNFTHGRHVFLDKHPHSTILMLVSPRDELFVNAMLKLMPSNRPVIIIRTERKDMLGALQLMICTFYLSIDICAPLGINPFSPGAPSWGGKLWALKLGAEKR